MNRKKIPSLLSMIRGFVFLTTTTCIEALRTSPTANLQANLARAEESRLSLCSPALVPKFNEASGVDMSRHRMHWINRPCGLSVTSPRTDFGMPALGGRRDGNNKSSKLCMVPPAVASILSGSIAGAIGVGVAFPLDTLKTNAQVMGSKQQKNQQALVSASDGKMVSTNHPNEGAAIFRMFHLIWKRGGLRGFFGGVRTMMIGKAMIKAVAFSSNLIALSFLQHRFGGVIEGGRASSASLLHLLIAACWAGFVASFVVAPVERTKVLMQSRGTSVYPSEMDCIRSVLRTEGWRGLLGVGLGPTLAREIPSYGINFVVYGMLMQTGAARAMGSAAPLVFGALSGCACWIPVYPIDVVKTLAQNCNGGGGGGCLEEGSATSIRKNSLCLEDADNDSVGSAWGVTKRLYREGGVGAFFVGITPKLLMAALSHSVTFWMYAVVMRLLTGTTR